MKAYIKKIAYYVPQTVAENPPGRLTRKTGILRRHICNENEIASDLAIKAAENLFAKGVARDKIEFLIYCTQSPDYFLPTTACILQNELGLPQTCGCLDYNLGCSGYIYGLSMAKGLIESGQVSNVLLLTAETYSKYINERDNAVKPLFGDGATATLLEAVRSSDEGMTGFVFGTDGSGYQNLIVPVGGMRHPFRATAEQAATDEYGNYRTNRDLYMDGGAIGNFAFKVVPDTVNKVLAKTGLTREEIGYFVFHQANKFMLDYLRINCELQERPFWIDVENYGNTVSCSVPIALCDLLTKENLTDTKIMLIGFGVGLSWGGCVVDVKFYKR